MKNSTTVGKALLFNVLICVITGALIFMLVHGYRIINPFYTDWLLIGEHTTAENYIGWEFFRKAPWQFPFGVFNTLSYPINTSIINPDSIPLLALFFKLFSGILPEKFQYIGIWGLVCYIMQCVLGMIICRKYVEKTIYGEICALLGGILFTLLPVLSFWMLWYSAQSSLWLLLLCIIPIIYYNEINYKNKIIIYSIAAFLTASLHPYLVAICGIIVLGHVLYDILQKKSIRQILLIPFVYSFIALLTLYLYGGFSMNANASTKKEFLFQMSFNLNGFFNPFDTSSIFKGLPYITNQYEGYSYLGLGIFVLIAIFICLVLYNKLTKKNSQTYTKFEVIVYTFLLVIPFILALSPEVTFGNKVLFTVPLPDFIYNLWSVLRATGRFIFIVNCVLLTVIITYFIKNLRLKTVIFILLYCITLQITDMHRFYIAKHNFFGTEKKFESFLCNEKWSEITKNNDIDVVYIHNAIRFLGGGGVYIRLYAKIEGHIAQWAVENGLKINNFDFSRPVKNIDKAYYEEIMNPKDSDIFLFLQRSYPKDVIEKSPLKYFYILDNLILARIVPIRGLEEFEITKDNILKHDLIKI